MNFAKLCILASIAAFAVTSPGTLRAAEDPFEVQVPSRPAHQAKIEIDLPGVSAVQLAWWFQHIADNSGRYWKATAPDLNRSISWVVNPREDAHQLIGALFSVEQALGPAFTDQRFEMQLQFQDYITNRGWKPGMVKALNPTLAYPEDYDVPYPSPLVLPPIDTLDPKSPVNGFNEQLLLLDGAGFSPGRLLVSWKNTGGDDTLETSAKEPRVHVVVTLYMPWMEGANHPDGRADGYYFDDAQRDAILAAWHQTLHGLVGKLPGWFGEETQDDLARSKGWTVGAVVDTGVVEGADSKMWVWWWNHGMGDAPGSTYAYWCPPAHYTIRWLPGFSPSEVLGGKDVPDDRVVPGIIYPDLQGASLVQSGGGMMSYPPEMSPIPGRFDTINPMMVVSRKQVEDFANERFPEPLGWLLHQWGDVPGGVIHRSTALAKLPLRGPLTQQGFYSEHQMMEGQFFGTDTMKRVYRSWLEANRKG